MLLDEQSEDPVVLVLSAFSSAKINSNFTQFDLEAFEDVEKPGHKSDSLGRLRLFW